MAHELLKPGEHGEIFVSQTKTKTFKARVRVRLLDGDLTEISRTRKARTAARLAVQAEIDSLLKRPKGSVELQPDSKVGLAARQWIDELRVQAEWPRPRRRPQTIDEYERLLGTLMVPKLGKLRLNELTTARCQAWLNAIVEKGRGRPNDMTATAAQVRVAFKGVLDRAIIHDAIRTNPLDKTALPLRKQPDPKALTTTAVYLLRQAVREWESSRVGRPGPPPNGHLPVAVDVMLGTGLRIGEVLALQWGNVNLTEDGLPTISVTATMVDVKGQGTIRQEMPKTDAGKRTIIIPPFTVQALRALRPDITSAELPVFPSRRLGNKGPRPQTPANVRRTLRLALDANGMKGEVRPHLLRSTVATFVARERGTGDAAMLLGHKVMGGVTEKHYIERLRVAPDVSSVLQAMIEIGEEEAGVRAEKTAAERRRTEILNATASATVEAVADAGTGW